MLKVGDLCWMQSLVYFDKSYSGLVEILNVESMLITVQIVNASIWHAKIKYIHPSNATFTKLS